MQGTDEARPWWYVRSVFANPYHRSGAIVARLSVSFATIIWALIVMYKPNALASWPGSDVINLAGGENHIAFGLLLASLIAIARVVYHYRPIRIGACIYGLMALLWVYSLTTLFVSIEDGRTALRPGQVACISVITVLALFAFVSNPRRDRPK